MKYIKDDYLLTIRPDEDPESPREWSNLGYFITIDRDYNSPDNHPDFMEIVKETGEEASDQADHIKRIEKEIAYRLGDKVLAIYPISKYEHGGVAYSLGTKHGFDYSNNGFYIITEKSQKEMGTNKKDFEKVVREEISHFNKYANGEVLGFVLEKKQPESVCHCCGHDSGSYYEVINSCYGFYSIEDIFEALPEGLTAENEWNEIN